MYNREFVHIFTRLCSIISGVLVERTAIWSAAYWPAFVVSPARRCCKNKRMLQRAASIIGRSSIKRFCFSDFAQQTTITTCQRSGAASCRNLRNTNDSL
jgi:hypothetical protein